MLPQQFSNPRPPEIDRKEKKSACKINENDLKIAWKCTLRKSNFKNFPGEAPRTPLMRANPLILSPLSRLTPLDTCLRQSMPTPPPPPSSDFLGPAPTPPQTAPIRRSRSHHSLTFQTPATGTDISDSRCRNRHLPVRTNTGSDRIGLNYRIGPDRTLF